MTITPTPPPMADPTTNQTSPRGQTLTLTPTPWAQVVRGGESPESSSPPPPLSPGESSGKVVNGNVGKKPAWNKPINGVMTGDHAGSSNGNGVDAGGANGGLSGGGGGVIGGSASWPALSESTRSGFKSSVVDSVKSPVDGSGPITSNVTKPERGGSNTNHSTVANNAGPTRPRMTRRGGGGGGVNRQGSFSRGSTADVAPRPGSDSSLRDSRPSNHPNHRGSNRRGNYGQQSHVDGRSNSYHGGNHERNPTHTQPPMGGFVRPYLQVAPPFPVPPPFRPYVNAMPYPDMPPVIYYPFPPESFRGVPSFPAPPPPPYVAVAEPPLHVSIVRQIDYYFSDANLVKDEYLRKNMDEHGWVNIGLIASFPRVQNLTTNIPLILQCLNRLSLVVEVQGDKVRRRDDWKKWANPNQLAALDSGPKDTCDSTEDTLAQTLQNTSLQEEVVNHGQTLNELTEESKVENKENED